MGYSHPDELLNNLTASQITEWEAFNRIQPIGHRRLDVYFSHFMTSLHNIALGFSGTKNAKQFKVEDFVPNWTGIEEEPDVMSAEQIKQFFAAFNKKVQEDKERQSTIKIKK